MRLLGRMRRVNAFAAAGSNGRGFTMDLMHQLGIEVNQITSQVFVANVSVYH